MATALSLVPTPTAASLESADEAAVLPIEALGESIASLAAQLHAATYELLVLLRAFDERLGWNNGFMSCAHWLHWRTGINPGAAREKVRVAKALAALPLVSEAMRHGRLSYAKVRAVTRVATPASEGRLLDLALAATASQVERVVRAWRHADRSKAIRDTAARHLSRHLSTWVDDDGMVVIRGRLTPDAGALVCRALEMTVDRLFRESARCPKAETISEDVTSAQRRADSLALIAEAALGADLDRGCAADHVQVVLHVETDTAEVHAGEAALKPEADFSGVLEVGSGAIRVSAETSLRLTCDASVVEMSRDSRVTSSVGRKTRTVPSSIRRALAARDVTCQFPGCTSRRCDAHHIVHWAVGGAASLENLVRLCRRHHRVVHEGGYHVERVGDAVAYFDPRGRRIEVAPAPPSWRDDQLTRAATLGSAVQEQPLAGVILRLRADGIDVGPRSAPVWEGGPFDLGWVLTVVHGGVEGPVG